jgi:hypothetical protein
MYADLALENRAEYVSKVVEMNFGVSLHRTF